MKCSICIATYNKPLPLKKTIESILSQSIPFDWELIIVDDGSESSTQKVCDQFEMVQYTRIDRLPGYRNPSVARNIAYQQAVGEVIICQSDDVYHHTPNSVKRLVDEIQPKTFVLATVTNVDSDGNHYADSSGKGYGDYLMTYVGPKKQRPLFFLGAVYRKDLYAVGGNDEEFQAPSGEDRWFALCLMNGQKLKPIYSYIEGHHQAHKHCDPNLTQPSQQLLRKKTKLARSGKHPWCSSNGSWIF